MALDLIYCVATLVTVGFVLSIVNEPPLPAFPASSVTTILPDTSVSPKVRVILEALAPAASAVMPKSAIAVPLNVIVGNVVPVRRRLLPLISIWSPDFPLL